MDKMELVERLVAFCILMGAKEEILEKAPLYILEKFSSCINYSHPERLLDPFRKRLMERWKERWLK